MKTETCSNIINPNEEEMIKSHLHMIRSLIYVLESHLKLHKINVQIRQVIKGKLAAF